MCFESINNANLLSCGDRPFRTEDTSIIECNLLRQLRYYLPYLIQQGYIVKGSIMLRLRVLGSF